MKRKKLFRILTLVLVPVLVLAMASCASRSKNTAAATPADAFDMAQSTVQYHESTAVEEAAGPIPEPSEAPQASNQRSSGLDGEAAGGLDMKASDSVSADDLLKQRKLIKDGNVFIETHDFDSSIMAMDELVESVGGFAETRTVRGKSSQSYSLRSASYIIRVPQESFDAVIKSMGNVGTVIESTTKGTDITDQYYDHETRVKTLKVQEQTLLDILSKAEKLEDVITLESRISEVRYEIESLENTLKNYDRLVSFSRINVNIQEVDDVTETRPVYKTLDQRIAGSFYQALENFRTGFEDFLVWAVGSWITVLLLIFIVMVIAVLIKRGKRKKLKAQKNRPSQPSGINTENKAENREQTENKP